MSISFSNSVKKFVQAGIHPKWFLPIAPVGANIGKNSGLSETVLGKAPGRFNEKARVWSGLGGGLITNGLEKRDFQEFANWPTPNVGLLGRSYPGIDSDANSDDARLLVEEVIYKTFGKDAKYGERLRGPGPRRLYAFKCQDPNNSYKWVRTRHISYKMKGDETDHKLDIIGYGNQYVITGVHPSGDDYKWHPDADLAQIAGELTEITNDDMERFIQTFYEILEDRKGEIVRSSGGGGNGEEIDIRDLEPVMPVEAVIEGLKQIPNSPETFLHRDDFVSALAAVRAALGKASLDKNVEDAVFEWATEDESWCDEEYFDKIWRSLDRVRVGRDSLDRLFRRNGVNSHIKYTFDTKDFSSQIKKHKDRRNDDKSVLLDKAASRYLFGYVNTRENQSKITMRDRWNVDREWNAYDWWRMELPETDKNLVGDLHEIEGYQMSKVGLANFLRDLHLDHPDIWYAAEGRHPGYDKGEIVEEEQPDGNIRRFVNMRYLSPAIRHGRKPDPDPQRSQKDLRLVLDFINKLFGPMAKYELDTLAYMAQTSDRPGSMLFIVGESGVGKSIWMNMQMALFDGVGPEQSGIIDGSKLQNENARRFMLGKVEGCRILSIRELPEGGNARDMAAITAQLKQLVDPGPEGDFVTVEAKGENPRPAKNFARVLISSNYANAIHVEQYDRRIFYVQAQITLETKPGEEFYSELVNITNDPTRLAALWRYLKQREINGYSRYTPPPISTEKAERIIAEIEQPHLRHTRAAIELLKVSGRKLFDTEEFAEIMTLMSEREHINSGGEVPHTVYERVKSDGRAKPEFMAAIKSIRKHEAVKLERELRTATSRPPTIYVMGGHSELMTKLLELDKNDIFDMLRADMDKSYAKHPWRMYQKSADAKQ